MHSSTYRSIEAQQMNQAVNALHKQKKKCIPQIFQRERQYLAQYAINVRILQEAVEYAKTS